MIIDKWHEVSYNIQIMSQLSHIRLARTPELERVIAYLRNRYSLLSEAEIIKLALSEKYQKEIEKNMEKERQLRKAYHHAMEEGRKVGIKMIKDKGLDPDKVSEQEFYDTFLNPHKNS